ncbi:MAG: hypothetical protein R2695_17435 [Acidimicrobiales bacterium]
MKGTGHVDVSVLPPDIGRRLPDRLEEREDLDVADSIAAPTSVMTTSVSSDTGGIDPPPSRR